MRECDERERYRAKARRSRPALLSSWKTYTCPYTRRSYSPSKISRAIEPSIRDRARRIVPGTRFALYQKCWGGVMINETELFYLVVLILLTLIIHLVLTITGPRRDGKAHR